MKQPSLCECSKKTRAHNSHNIAPRIKFGGVSVHNLSNIHLKHLVFAHIKAELFLTLLTLRNAIKSCRTHRQRQGSFDVQRFGDRPSPPAMDGDLPEAQVAFKHFVPAGDKLA